MKHAMTALVFLLAAGTASALPLTLYFEGITDNGRASRLPGQSLVGRAVSGSVTFDTRNGVFNRELAGGVTTTEFLSTPACVVVKTCQGAVVTDFSLALEGVGVFARHLETDSELSFLRLIGSSTESRAVLHSEVWGTSAAIDAIDAIDAMGQFEQAFTLKGTGAPETLVWFDPSYLPMKAFRELLDEFSFAQAIVGSAPQFSVPDGPSLEVSFSGRILALQGAPFAVPEPPLIALWMGCVALACGYRSQRKLRA